MSDGDGVGLVPLSHAARHDVGAGDAQRPRGRPRRKPCQTLVELLPTHGLPRREIIGQVTDPYCTISQDGRAGNDLVGHESGDLVLIEPQMAQVGRDDLLSLMAAPGQARRQRRVDLDTDPGSGDQGRQPGCVLPHRCPPRTDPFGAGRAMGHGAGQQWNAGSRAAADGAHLTLETALSVPRMDDRCVGACEHVRGGHRDGLDSDGGRTGTRTPGHTLGAQEQAP